MKTAPATNPTWPPPRMAVSTRSATPMATNVTDRMRFTRSIGSPGRLRADHHPAVGVPQHVVDHPAEHPLAAALALLGAQHDDLRPPPAGLVDDRLSDVAGAGDARDHEHPLFAAQRRRPAPLP